MARAGLPPEIERNIAAAYDLDKPLYEQYFIYLGRLLQGDFGPSFKIRDFTVSELIMQGFPVSLRLGLLAMTLAMVVGTTLGVIAALRQNRPTDYSVMSRRDDRHLHSLLRHRAVAAARVRHLRRQSVRARSVAPRRRLEQRRGREHGACR